MPRYMEILSMMSAPGWSAVYLDEGTVDPLPVRLAKVDRPPTDPPLLRKPLVCWAHVQWADQYQVCSDGTRVPSRQIVGMEALIGPDGDAQVAPSGGDTFVGYLHESEDLESLRAHAQFIWEVSQMFQRGQDEEG